MKKNIESLIEYYAKLPYQIVIEPWDDGNGPYYLARVLELQGCMIHGDTPEEALREIEGVKRDWIKTNIEIGNKMPQPLRARNFSGNIVVRMPPSLHETLATVAELECVSLNQYMVSALSRSAGRDEVLIKERKATYKKSSR